MLLPFAPPALQAPQPASLPPQLTLEDALRLLQTRGLDLLLAEAAVAQAKGDLQSGGALPGAQLGLTAGKAENYVVQLPGQSARSYSATLSDGGILDDLLIGRRSLRVRALDAALKAARLGREDALRTVGTLLKTQFVQTALAALNLDLATQTRDAARATFELVQKTCAAGATSEVDVARAEIAYLETEQGLESARQGLASARATLAFLLGERGPVPPFTTVGSFDHPRLPEGLAHTSPEALLEQARSQRPDLAAARAQEERTQAALALAKREWVPQTEWSVAVAQQGTGENALQPRTWTLGVNLALPSARKVEGDTSRARADLQVQQLTLRKAEAQAALDVASGWAAFESGRVRLAHMEDRLLGQAKKTYDAVQFQYSRGATSLLDVLDAQRTWIATRNEYVQNLNDYWNGLFTLEQAVGKEFSR